MTTLAEVTQKLTDLNAKADAAKTGLDAVGAKIEELKAQIAAGSPVTQADLDAIAASIDTASGKLDAIVTEEGTESA